MRRASRAAALVLAAAACSPAGAPGDGGPRAVADAPRSVILLVGDGMGPQQVGLLLDWASAAGRSPTRLERLAAAGTTGLLRTAPAGGVLTDSAAGATALACGVSTRNGRIATGPDGSPLRTCLEDARERGRRVGLVTTTTITHATPAAFAAHAEDRGEESGIAAQYVDGAVADVLLGGGQRFFSDAVVAAAAAKGYRVVRDRDELAAAPSDGRLLGLFSRSHVPYALDRDTDEERRQVRAPTLAEMARKALDVVSRGDAGFFLMIEGGRIDHACHANDAAAALGELREFDDAIGVCEDFRAAHPETLVVVTADHETGGLALTSGRPPYSLEAADLVALAKVERSIEATGVGGKPPADFDPEATFGVGRAPFYPPDYWVADAAALARSAQYSASFATGGHSATPVPIVAAGPGAAAFGGVNANAVVGRRLREWMAR